MSEDNWQGRNPAGSRNGARSMTGAWSLALLALVMAGGHRLLGAAPATPVLELVCSTVRSVFSHAGPPTGFGSRVANWKTRLRRRRLA